MLSYAYVFTWELIFYYLVHIVLYAALTNSKLIIFKKIAVTVICAACVCTDDMKTWHCLIIHCEWKEKL